jgi:ribosomal protein S17
MKKAFYITFIAAGIAATVFSSSCNIACKQGSGTTSTDNRKVSDFTKIEISGGYKVVLKQDSSLSVSVTVDDNLQKYVKTTVSGSTLRIENDGNICASGDAVVIVGVRNLEKIDGSGAVEIRSDGKLVTKDLDIDLSGAGKLNLDLDAANVHTEGSGATELTFKGQATSHSIELSGTGNVEALDFIVGSYNIETSGASESRINVLKSLIVKTSGASNIQYKGNPTTVKNHESGASTIKKID